MEPPLHDPTAVFYLINKDAFKTKYQCVEIETKSQFCDGRTNVDTMGIYKGKKVNVGWEMDQKLFWDCMYKAIETCDKQ